MQACPLRSASGLVSIIPAAIEHAPELAALVAQNTEYLRAYLPAVADLSSVEAAQTHLASCADRASRNGLFEWHLFVDGSLCGSVRLKDIDPIARKAAVGYFLGGQFTGRGIATSALRAILDYGFGPLDLNRMELRCAAGNGPSRRVAERLGFVQEGLLRQEEFLNGVFVDTEVYGLLRADFEAQRPRRMG